MRIKKECFKCHGQIFEDTCPKCGAANGYLQNVKSKELHGETYHLNEILVHGPSSNQYRIKEIQEKGFICVLYSSPAIAEHARAGLKVYIGFSDILTYKRKIK